MYNERRCGPAHKKTKTATTTKAGHDTQDSRDTHRTGHRKGIGKIGDGARTTWRQSVAARLSQKSNRSQDRQTATQTDSQTEGFTYGRICLCVRLCVCFCVCVCTQSHMRGSVDAFSVCFPDAKQAPFCRPWTLVRFS